jgi:predicted nucleotidyltransferase
MKNVDSELLNEIVVKIVNSIHPEKVFLYGSHAYGIPHEESDIDLLIVSKDLSISTRAQAVKVYQALHGVLAPVEVKVDTKEGFSRRSRWINSIERIVSEKRRLLYESVV